MSELLNWFSGGSRQYHDLYHCMKGDTLWIVITVVLDLLVATGYGLIAIHWWKNQKSLENSHPARIALGNMRNIFVFCGICGYAFIPIKMYWPAWRLYDFFMVALAYFTWRYAWRAKDLKVVYNELGKTKQLAMDLEKSRHETKRKSFFLNAVSHDMRTPLNSLVLQTEVAEISLQSQDIDTLRETIADMKVSALAATELLNSFLELGRLDWVNETHQIVDANLGEIVDGVIQRARVDAERKGLALKCQSVPSMNVKLDRMKLERILDNLVMNAVKFTDSGHVTVSVEFDSQLRIHVDDSGAGIADEHLERLFDEFYQVTNDERNRTKGFGLGLAIVRRLAHQMGGEIHVESELGRGSRFTLALPRSVCLGGHQPSDSPAVLATPAAG